MRRSAVAAAVARGGAAWKVKAMPMRQKCVGVVSAGGKENLKCGEPMPAEA